LVLLPVLAVSLFGSAASLSGSPVSLLGPPVSLRGSAVPRRALAVSFVGWAVSCLGSEVLFCSASSKAFKGKNVSMDTLEFVANQDDWKKHVRELRYLG